jgi:acetyl esterase/lipase
MDWLYLVLSAIGLALTWNAFRPYDSQPIAATLSWVAGWVTGELALHWIVIQALVTLGFAMAGALETVPGLLGLVLSVVSWIGLGVWYGLSGRSGAAAERALCEGLGEPYSAEIEPELASRLPRGIDLRQIANPLPRLPQGVERIRGIQFGRARGVDLKLDIWRPQRPVEPRPTLLQVHGGAWRYGRRMDQALPLMHQMSRHGWLCASVDYRLSPHATFPEHLIDLKNALAWLRGKGVEYGVDPGFIAVTGGSAGGHLASLMALTANDPEYQPGFEAADTCLQGCVVFYGIYDFADRHGDCTNDGLSSTLERSVMKASREEAPAEYERASPLSRIHSDAPPFFIVHGDRDNLAPLSMARRFAETLREKSTQSVSFAEIPGAHHAFESFHSLRAQQVVHAVERFLTYIYSEHRRQPGVKPADPGGVGAP